MENKKPRESHVETAVQLSSFDRPRGCCCQRTRRICISHVAPLRRCQVLSSHRIYRAPLPWMSRYRTHFVWPTSQYKFGLRKAKGIFCPAPCLLRRENKRHRFQFRHQGACDLQKKTRNSLLFTPQQCTSSRDPLRQEQRHSTFSRNPIIILPVSTVSFRVLYPCTIAVLNMVRHLYNVHPQNATISYHFPW